MSPFKQSAGASSSKHALNGMDDTDDADNHNWLQQRYRELAQIYGVDSIPEPSSTFWAPRHPENQSTYPFDPAAEAHFTSHHNTFTDDSALPTAFMGSVEDLDGLNGVYGQDPYGGLPPFGAYMGNPALVESSPGMRDHQYPLGEEARESAPFTADSEGSGSFAHPSTFMSLPPPTFSGSMADLWVIPPGFPGNLPSTSNAAFHDALPQAPPPPSHATPDTDLSTIDPALLQTLPQVRDDTPPVLRDIDPVNSSPERPPHPASLTTARKAKRTLKAKRERSERENIPSVIPAPPSRRVTRPRAPEAEEAGPARKRRRRCELEETQGTAETRCGLDGCEEILRASDLDGARKHFNTHVKPEKTATTAKGKKGKKPKKAGKDATKQEFRCTYVEEDGKKCAHKPWTGKQALQRHVEGKHYQWSFECPVCGRVFQRRDALKRHQKPTNSRCHQPPEPEAGQDDAPA
ncbi:hypothetical protein TRAPUB_2687 [Trametes pubescens]|uniref:C2H2-type domain-containing protein n=1 Tax=Trametes pubescens TaxID=154538 RepID=A0A1M2VFM7_TRAPU|nr:hypothetical protein TRAPUB_2687 [Trametes pubescens]